MKLMRSTTLATMALTLLSALPLAGPVAAKNVRHTASAVSTKTWSVQGALTIGRTAVIFPVGSTFTASYNSNSGALTNGSLSVPERTMSYPGHDVGVSVKFKDLGDATGTLAPNGDATINESLTATINMTGRDAQCDVGPMDITVSTASDRGSPFRGTPSTGTLVDSEFTAPYPTVTDTCSEYWAHFYSKVPVSGRGNVKVTLTEVVNPVSNWSTKAWDVQGALHIGLLKFKFPSGSRFTASYDSNSGTLANGSLSVPESTLIGFIGVKLNDLGDATGTLAPNGVATISESLTATMKITQLDAACDIGPIDVTVGTLAAGGSAFHGTPASGTLVAPHFTAPSVTLTSHCPEDVAGLFSPLPADGSLTVTLTEILSASAAFSDPVQRPVFAPGIENAVPSQSFSAISCSSPGNCTAAGHFVAADGSWVPMTQTSTNGVWALAVPADVTGIAGSGAEGSFNAISCSAAGDCTAAGQFNHRAITQTSTNGVWAPAVEAVFSDDAVRGNFPFDRFNAISCSAAGYCTAAGEYTSGDHRSPMSATSTDGVWDHVTVVDVPSSLNIGVDTAYSQVSCGSAGYCTATGFGYSANDHYYITFYSTSTFGAWGELNFISGYKIVALSCPELGDCTGAGSISFNDNVVAVTIKLHDGSLQQEFPEMVNIDPAQQSQNPDSSLQAISCTASAYCTAVGRYRDMNGIDQPLMTTSNPAMIFGTTIGLWSPVALSNAKDSLGNSVQYPQFTAVSCSSPGNCTAAGSVYEGDQQLAATLSQTDGVWAPIVVATFGSNVTPTPAGSRFSAISCSGPSSCTAAGDYYTSDDYPLAITMSTRSAGPPSAPVSTTAEGAPGHAIVSWQPPRTTYGVAVSEYRVTVVRANTTTVVATLRVPGTTTQKIVTLPAGSYSVSVAAVTSIGVGASATTSSFSVTSTKGVRVPPAPRIMPSKVANGQVTLSWLPPVLSDGGSLIYQYVATDEQGHGCVVGTDARIAVNTFTCTVTGLTNGRGYSFTVQAVNIMGASIASSVKYMIPASAPTTAPTLSINEITTRRATFDITAPTDMGGRPLMYYRVSYDNGRTWSSLAKYTSGDQVYLGLLKRNTTYHVLICAKNAIGSGPAAAVTFTTPRR